MFTSGMSEFANLLFSLLTMIVAVPSAIKVFNWVSTSTRDPSISSRRFFSR